MTGTTRMTALEAGIAAYRCTRRSNDVPGAWTALERAHIRAQPVIIQHLRIHALMPGVAVRTGGASEAVGQLARLAPAPLGAIAGRMACGNTGRSNVSVFRAMPVPDDLRRLPSPPPERDKAPG